MDVVGLSICICSLSHITPVHVEWRWKPSTWPFQSGKWCEPNTCKSSKKICCPDPCAYGPRTWFGMKMENMFSWAVESYREWFLKTNASTTKGAFYGFWFEHSVMENKTSQHMHCAQFFKTPTASKDQHLSNRTNLSCWTETTGIYPCVLMAIEQNNFGNTVAKSNMFDRFCSTYSDLWMLLVPGSFLRCPGYEHLWLEVPTNENYSVVNQEDCF